MEFNPLSLLILKFRGRSTAVIRQLCIHYEDILPVAQRSFQTLHGAPIDDIVILASIPGYPDQSPVEISMDIWLLIYPVVHSVTIALQSEMQPANEGSSSVSPDSNGSGVRTATAGLFRALTASSPLPAPSVRLPTRSFSRPPQRVVSEQSRNSPQTHASLVFDADDLGLDRGRKPVIYLFSPSVLPIVTVELLLTSTWSFSAVYPPPNTFPSGERQTPQSLTWAIAAEPSGTLIDKTTGTEVSYLFWEAIAISNPMTPNTSRTASPVGDVEAFDPSRPSVSPGNSILLPIGKVPGYLDTALKALTLHTEARTSFITYWLPDLLKHEYVALRFLPQASYEQAAKMRVSPAPDIVTRIFMLFRGVAPGDLGFWSQAAARATAEDGATFWANVVGIDSARASDPRLFRVLEWGGMEVKRWVSS